MKIAVESWEAYNNGILACKWFDTEIDSIEEIEEFFKKFHEKYNLSNDLELFVADYEDEACIYKSDSILEAYEITEKTSDLDAYDLKKVSFMVDYSGYTLKNALNRFEDCELYEDTSLSDLAYDFVEDGIFGEINESIKGYIDYEAIGRDLSFNGYVEYNGDVLRCN